MSSTVLNLHQRSKLLLQLVTWGQLYSEADGQLGIRSTSNFERWTVTKKNGTMYDCYFFVWKARGIFYVVVLLNWSIAHQLKISVSLKIYSVYIFFNNFQLCSSKMLFSVLVSKMLFLIGFFIWAKPLIFHRHNDFHLFTWRFM